jgi:hypothetical protein
MFVRRLNEMKPDQKAMVAAFVRERRLRGITDTTFLDDLPNPDNILRNTVTLQGALDVMRDVFGSPMERLNRALLNIARLSPGLGQGLDFNDLGTVYAENSEAAFFVLSALQETGYISWEPVTGILAHQVALTIHGYNRIAELEAERKGLDSDQAFVAMWFHPVMDVPFNDGIAPAIVAAGYTPKCVRQSVRPDDITDEIIAEIRKSRFVVADVTGQRQGVYYEAGFAKGLGLQVIWTVREDEKDKVHFDTRQYRHIIWKAPEDLRKQLQVSIEANIPKAPKKR